MPAKAIVFSSPVYNTMKGKRIKNWEHIARHWEPNQSVFTHLRYEFGHRRRYNANERKMKWKKNIKFRGQISQTTHVVFAFILCYHTCLMRHEQTHIDQNEKVRCGEHHPKSIFLFGFIIFHNMYYSIQYPKMQTTPKWFLTGICPSMGKFNVGSKQLKQI